MSQTRVGELVRVVDRAERDGGSSLTAGWKPLNRYISVYARPHANDLKVRLERAVEEQPNNHNRIHALQRQLSCSFDVRLVALDEANRKQRARRRLRASALIRQAMELKVHERSTEVVPVHLFEKRSGGYRQVAIPQLEHRARQRIIEDQLRPFRRSHPNQFNASGNGNRDAAIEQVCAALEAGHLFTCHMDIRDAFPSCSAEAIRRMLGQHIHRGVIENNILASCLNMRIRQIVPLFRTSTVYDPRRDQSSFAMTKMVQSLPRDDTEPLQENSVQQRNAYLSTQGPNQGPYRPHLIARGLPQGFSSSAAVFDMVVFEILSACGFPETVVVPNFADDFLIMGRTEQDVLEAINTMQGVLERQHGGSLRVSRPEIRHAREGFTFLGFRIARSEGETTIDVSEASWEKARMNFERKLRAGLRKSKNDAIRKVRNTLLGFIQSYSVVPDIAAEALLHMENVFLELLNESSSLPDRLGDKMSDRLLRIPIPALVQRLDDGKEFEWSPPDRRRQPWNSSRERRLRGTRRQQNSAAPQAA